MPPDPSAARPPDPVAVRRDVELARRPITDFDSGVAILAARQRCRDHAAALLAEVASLRAERDAALARLAAVTRERNDAIARKHGFDRRGPHKGAPSPERGFACECEWSSSRHGDTCPEHGARGVPIPHPPEEMEARLAAAEGERDRWRADVERSLAVFARWASEVAAAAIARDWPDSSRAKTAGRVAGLQESLRIMARVDREIARGAGAAAMTLERDGWVPAAERLPEPFRPVLIALRSRGVTEVRWSSLAKYDGENAPANDYWDLGGSSYVMFTEGRVTHWMPLPAGPAGGGGAEGEDE